MFPTTTAEINILTYRMFYLNVKFHFNKTLLKNEQYLCIKKKLCQLISNLKVCSLRTDQDIGF